MSYNVLMISTCTNDKYILNLLQSISENNHSISVFLIVLFQNNLYIDTSCYETEWLHICGLYSPALLSLSAARNIGINYVVENNIKSDYVMFPDDDTLFDSNFFQNFLEQIHGNTLIDVYCSGTRKLYQMVKHKDATLLVDNKAAMSVNMIICYDLFIKIGLFDPMMGVGATYGAGEDGDYFLRGCKILKSGFFYNKKMWNFHPAATTKHKKMTLLQLKNKYKNYGRGVMYLYYKHGMYVSALECIVSGFLGMLIAYCSFDFKLGIARFYGFSYRLLTFFDLLLCSKSDK